MLFSLLNILCMISALYAPLSLANLIAYNQPFLLASLTLPKVPSPKVSSISQSQNMVADMQNNQIIIQNVPYKHKQQNSISKQSQTRCIYKQKKTKHLICILSSWHRHIKSSYYTIDDYIKPLDNKNRKYRRIIVNKMENQLSCSNIVLKSVKDVAELKQKLGKRVPFEMEQISQMFNQNQNSSFNFDVLNARKNFSAKNQDVDDKMNIKQAFFRRYAEMNVGRDRVVEDCGFDMMMLGNKAKSLNIKNPVITQSVKQFIPRNRFLALNKIMRLKSPKKLEPLSTLNNLKVNTSLVFKNEDKPQEKSQEIQISIRKRRLLPLLSDQGRTSAFSRSQRTEASPQISPKPSSSMQQTPNFRPTPSISPTTQKRVLKNESIKPIKKQTMYTLKQLLKNRRKKEDNKKIEKKGRNILTEGNEDSGHKKNYTPLEPWKIQIEGADFQFIA